MKVSPQVPSLLSMGLATWQGRATDLRVPASVFASAYPCGPP